MIPPDPSKIPILFKYHKLNLNLIQLLTNNSFYCAGSNELNDPYDCYLRFGWAVYEDIFNNDFISYKSFEGNNITYRTETFQKYIKRNPLELYFDPETTFELKSFKNDIRGTIDALMSNITFESLFIEDFMKLFNIRIVSFSAIKEKNDILMWAHYTEAFTGVRLKFDFRDDILILDNLHPIEYFENWPVVLKTENISSAFLMKRDMWKNEFEWRILLNEIKHIKFQKSSLKEIVFGYNSPDKLIFSIMVMCEKLGYLCEFYKLYMSSIGIEKKLISVYVYPYNDYMEDKYN